MGDESILPIDDTNLENAFLCTDYSKVSLDDNIYVGQTSDGEYAIFEWKNKSDNNVSVIIVQWKGKSSRANTDSTVYLQIYNQTDNQWEVLDSDNITIANTEFILNGLQSINLSKYYDESNWVVCRVYQKAE